MSSADNWKSKVVDYETKRGQLNLAAGIQALETLQDNAARQAAYQDAESRAAYRAVWGQPMPEPEGDPEMRQYVLGNQTNQTTYQQPAAPAGRKWLPRLLLAAAACGLLPIVGAGGFVIVQKLIESRAADRAVDVLEIGLDKIENFEPPNQADRGPAANTED